MGVRRKEEGNINHRGGRKIFVKKTEYFDLKRLINYPKGYFYSVNIFRGIRIFLEMINEVYNWRNPKQYESMKVPFSLLQTELHYTLFQKSPPHLLQIKCELCFFPRQTNVIDSSNVGICSSPSDVMIEDFLCVHLSPQYLIIYYGLQF